MEGVLGLGRRILVVKESIEISETKQVRTKMIIAQVRRTETQLMKTVWRWKFAMGRAKETNLGHDRMRIQVHRKMLTFRKGDECDRN